MFAESSVDMLLASTDESGRLWDCEPLTESDDRLPVGFESTDVAKVVPILETTVLWSPIGLVELLVSVGCILVDRLEDGSGCV
jgi:hypothetical protein